MQHNRVAMVAVIILIVAAVLAIQSGAVTDLLSYDCRSVADALGANWLWHPFKGCFIQEPNGAWIPIDSNRNYSP